MKLVMVLLTFAISMPQTVCAMTLAKTGNLSCCTGKMACDCESTKFSTAPCRLNQAPASHTDVVVSCAVQSSPRLDVALFSLPSFSESSAFSAVAFQYANLNATTPPSGSPPQASLRLWLI